MAMNSNLNRGEWRKLEKLWAKNLKGKDGKGGKEVKVKIKVRYDGTSQRPISFIVQYNIVNIWEMVDFENKPGG